MAKRPLEAAVKKLPAERLLRLTSETEKFSHGHFLPHSIGDGNRIGGRVTEMEYAYGGVFRVTHVTTFHRMNCGEIHLNSLTTTPVQPMQGPYSTLAISLLASHKAFSFTWSKAYSA